MKPGSIVLLVLGILLFGFGVFGLVNGGGVGGVIPVLLGGALSYFAWRGGRVALIVFGHTCIVIGCLLITWGIYLLPYCEPTLSHVLGRPLFWGLFSLMGGICANYHGFCECARRLG